MQVRIIIVGDDNKTHPYEFPSFVDAINFLKTKLTKVEVSVEPKGEGDLSPKEVKEVLGKSDDVEESKKKEGE